jgi:ribulose 1,5-bisphosphate carboxylase large subunit-like protein
MYVGKASDAVMEDIKVADYAEEHEEFESALTRGHW